MSTVSCLPCCLCDVCWLGRRKREQVGPEGGDDPLSTDSSKTCLLEVVDCWAKSASVFGRNWILVPVPLTRGQKKSVDATNTVPRLLLPLHGQHSRRVSFYSFVRRLQGLGIRAWQARVWPVQPRIGRLRWCLYALSKAARARTRHARIQGLACPDPRTCRRSTATTNARPNAQGLHARGTRACTFSMP